MPYAEIWYARFKQKCGFVLIGLLLPVTCEDLKLFSLSWIFPTYSLQIVAYHVQLHNNRRCDHRKTPILAIIRRLRKRVGSAGPQLHRWNVSTQLCLYHLIFHSSVLFLPVLAAWAPLKRTVLRITRVAALYSGWQSGSDVQPLVDLDGLSWVPGRIIRRD